MNNKKSKKRKKKNNKGRILIMLVLLLALLIALIVGVLNTTSNRLRRQLRVAEKYLTDMEYESAIIAFDKAIAIDPKSVEAYVGKADTYIEMAKVEENQDNIEQAIEYYEDALEVAEIGYEQTQAEQFQEIIDEVTEIIEEYNEEMLEGTEEAEQDEVVYFDFGFEPESILVLGMVAYETPYEDYARYISSNYKRYDPLNFEGVSYDQNDFDGEEINVYCKSSSEGIDATSIVSAKKNDAGQMVSVGSLYEYQWDISTMYSAPFSIGQDYATVLEIIGLDELEQPAEGSVSQQIMTNYGSGRISLTKISDGNVLNGMLAIDIYIDDYKGAILHYGFGFNDEDKLMWFKVADTDVI